MLADFLATVKGELGLPNAAGLTADLHSLLVYEPDQFFLPHQDSEKSDDMVATLVVTLPSSHAGGELVVEHNGEGSTYRGSKTTLSLVAFYAHCRHEVLKVKSGYRTRSHTTCCCTATPPARRATTAPRLSWQACSGSTSPRRRAVTTADSGRPAGPACLSPGP